MLIENAVNVKHLLTWYKDKCMREMYGEDMRTALERSDAGTIGINPVLKGRKKTTYEDPIS